MANIDLRASKFYINRELSLLDFHSRVLAQATRENLPLLERLRFLCIASSNLDEFFEIRVAGLKKRVEYLTTGTGPDGLSSEQQLQRIATLAREFIDTQYRLLNDVLVPQLREQGVYFLKREEWSDAQRDWLRDYFSRELMPILSPVGLDPAHPFPRLLNKSLNFIVTLDGQDAFGRRGDMVVVRAPRALPRVVQLPRSVATHEYDFVFLSSIIHAHVGNLFQGMRTTGCHQFRLTRNSDLLVDEEEVTDLLGALQGELSSRRFGDAVRLEIAADCPEPVREFLRAQFELEPEDVYLCRGPVNLMRLISIPDSVDIPRLKYPVYTSRIPRRLQGGVDIFSVIRRGDILLHQPYESFMPVLDFLRQAAVDPQVVAIRQTLYRTGSESEVVKALIDAAHNNKEVLVVIELRARFDEADNIELAHSLQEAGAQVVYGVVGYKMHAKMNLVIRREADGLRRYVHLSTGNYHENTARVYTDYGLMTCEPEITNDIQQLFHQITSMGQTGELNKVLQAPFTLYEQVTALIEQEISNARAGKRARVVAKMNSLIEPKVIRTLYRASQAGVKIDLIVRGMCCLRPGIPGVSENITVRSIVGRFLEHERIFWFANDGEPKTYLSSADWMDRNFFRRVEACFPVENRKLADRVFREGLELYLKDNCEAWRLQPDGRYVPDLCSEGERTSAQDALLRKLSRLA